MKISLRIFQLSLVLTVILAGAATASPLPQAMIDALQQREQSLAHYTFNWQVDYKETDSGESPQEIAEKQRAAEEQIPAQLRKRGITDESFIRQQVQSLVQHYADQAKPISYNSSTPWQIARSGDETLVTGVRQLLAGPGNGSSEYYRQYYNKDAAIVINDKTEINGDSAKPGDSYAWASFGDSVRYRTLYQGGLGLIPEHFVVLTGLNPLTIYGAHWSLISETVDSWKLATEVTQRNWPQFHIEATLSRSHGGAPSQILVRSGRETLRLDTLNFRLAHGTWLCEKVKISDDSPGVTKIQLWSLVGIEPTKAINLTYTGSSFVHDYRLLGPDLNARIEPVLQPQQQSSLVVYRWPGHFPSLAELKQIHDHMHPGEATPDPGKSASLPFVGGLLCLVGGVWMFKRRGGGAV